MSTLLYIAIMMNATKHYIYFILYACVQVGIYITSFTKQLQYNFYCINKVNFLKKLLVWEAEFINIKLMLHI